MFVSIILGVPDYDKRTCDSIQWFESNWMSRISSTHGFLKSEEGIIVRRSGLYYIYAQVKSAVLDLRIWHS